MKNGYVEKNLISGEKIIHQTKLHWIVFCPSIFVVAVAVVAIIAGFTNEAQSAVYGVTLFLILVLVASLMWVCSYIRYSTWEFVVTNKRVLVKIGWLYRRSLEILLKKVESVAVDQSIFGRIFDYGTIVITGSGGTKELFRMISAPFEFRKMVQEQITKEK
jgi:uncharacterized membrane protein YdbT with pleckstrin-like domain